MGCHSLDLGRGTQLLPQCSSSLVYDIEEGAHCRWKHTGSRGSLVLSSPTIQEPRHRAGVDPEHGYWFGRVKVLASPVLV